MTRFHFHVENGTGFVADEEGRELAGVEAARTEALKGARSIIADEVLQGRLDLTGRVDVTDGDGKAIFTIHFEDAVVASDE